MDIPQLNMLWFSAAATSPTRSNRRSSLLNRQCYMAADWRPSQIALSVASLGEYHDLGQTVDGRFRMVDELL